MTGPIPQHFIDELINRTDIVDLIGGFVALKKAGKEFQACCPFHDEKTPSFTVSPHKQFYHCFGCGAHGTAIGFLMEHQHMGFVEAVEDLAARAGLEVPRDERVSPGPGHSLVYQALQQSAQFYQRQLKQHAQAGRAVHYLKDRGLTGQVAAEFGIGYAPPGWDNLLGEAGDDADRVQQLVRSGMVVEAEGKRYDRFRDRILFPIRDHRGRVIAFGGRALGDANPKYLNSPETPVFHKGRTLYGLWEARNALRSIRRLLVVEGYMDVVALAQFGIHYAVATLGTATTPEHLELLFRTAPEIVFCFDGDKAGREAAWKALNIALPVMREGREVRFLILPEGEDPDSLIRREGEEAFEHRLARAEGLSTVLFSRLREQADPAELEGRARLAELALPLLRQLPDGVLRKMMYQELSSLTRLEVAELTGSPPTATAKSRRTTRRRMTPVQMTPVRLAITLLLQHPDLAATVPENPDWQQLDEPGVGLLHDLLALLGSEPTLTAGAVLERWRGTPEAPHLGRLAGLKLPLPDEGLTAEFNGALARLSEQARARETDRLLDLARHQALSVEQKARLRELLTGG